MNKSAIKKKRKEKALEPDVVIKSVNGEMSILAENANDVMFVSAIALLKASNLLGMTLDNTITYLTAAVNRLADLEKSEEVVDEPKK